MQIDLLNEGMLGHWQARAGVEQCEFQFGTRLIYVQHPQGQPETPWLTAAQQVVQATWDDMPTAMAFAVEQSKATMPELWKLYERLSWAPPLLLIYSIHFDLDSPYPSYCISENPDFDWDLQVQVEDQPGQDHFRSFAQYQPGDHYWLTVRRLGAGRFELDR
ncbi:hypothetical protein J4P02_11415 [Pseudomonas sp. NFXW11]|uniref:hypothetical protein n=1 Tax=Pseudomonas sp. NFXW11 TaxID=2819531 RepID=UPI003CF06B63